MIKTLSKQRLLTIDSGQSVVFFEKQLAPKTQITIAKNAHVKHYRLHEMTDHSLFVRLEDNASYELITLHRGDRNLTLYFDLSGKNAFCQSNIVYVLSENKNTLIHCDVHHNADDTVSRQFVKGAVCANAKAVFQGGIFIPYNKKGIDGMQQHRALLLGKNACAQAVPQLEIYADDVKCAHGSAIGFLDQEQMFYLQSRGLDEEQARTLLTTAFLNEILDDIEDDEVREELKSLALEEVCHGN